jgi:hypothetical protein
MLKDEIKKIIKKTKKKYLSQPMLTYQIHNFSYETGITS